MKGLGAFRLRRLLPVACPRCEEIRATPPEDLVLFVNPGDPRYFDGRWLREEGERVRLMALAMHAAEGHE